METFFTLATLYLLLKIAVPIAAFAAIAYVLYKTFSRPEDQHTFASSLPEDRLVDPDDADRLP